MTLPWSAPAARAALWRGLLRLLFWAGGGVAGAVSYACGQSANLRVFSRAAADFAERAPLYPGVSPDYKYSPTFAMAFMALSALPPLGAAIAWGALNFGVAFEGLARVVPSGRTGRAAALALAGMLLTTDGDQSNLLLVGLVLLAFDAWERGLLVRAAIALAFATAIKLFPAAFLSLALLSARPARAVLYAVGALALLAVLPGVWLGAPGLLSAYRGWLGMLEIDYARVATGAHTPWSVGAMLEQGLGVSLPARGLEVVAGLVTTGPVLLAARRGHDALLRRALLVSLLLYVVLFSHRTEYCTFVIAAVAAAVWATNSRPTAVVVGLLAVAFLALGPVPALGGVPPTWRDWLTTPRAFHPLRLIGITTIWALVQGEVWTRLLAARRAEPSAC